MHSQEIQKNNVKTFKQHSKELVVRILLSFLLLITSAVFIYLQIDTIVPVLLSPIATEGVAVQFIGPLDPLLFLLKICFFGGLIMTLPMHFINVFSYIRVPSSFKDVRILIYIFSAAYVILGVVFFYTYFVVVPAVLSFVESIAVSGVEMNYSANSYLAFLINVTFLMSFNAMIPIPLLFLMKSGIITPNQLREKRKYVYPGTLVVVAIISPTIDAVSLVLLAAPALFMYEISILLGGRIGKQNL